MRLKQDSSPPLSAAFPLGRLGRVRPEPCLDLELQERFLGRKVPTRFWQRPGEHGFGDETAVLLGLGAERPELDARFLGDVRTVVYNWLVFWSAFGRQEIKAAFRVEPGEAGASFEVRPVDGNVDVPFILAALRRNGASLKPTLH
jgi:hypothetical protein